MRYGFKHYDYEFDNTNGKLISSTIIGSHSKNDSYDQMKKELTKLLASNNDLQILDKKEEDRYIYPFGDTYFIFLKGRNYQIFKYK